MSPPDAAYRVIATTALFTNRRDGISELEVFGKAVTGVQTKGPQFRITELPDGEAPLYVRGYHLSHNGHYAIFREVTDGTQTTVRYVVLTEQPGSLGVMDWTVNGVVVGPVVEDDDVAVLVNIDRVIQEAGL